MSEPLEIIKKLSDWGVEDQGDIYYSVLAAEDIATQAERYLSRGERHYIIAGRIPGAEENTIAHIKCNYGDDPWEVFVRMVLYRNGEPILPEDWRYSRRPDGYRWAVRVDCFEILGPPLSRS